MVAETLRVLRSRVAPGVTTAELDGCAAKVFADHGARSGPVLTYGYPGSVCISVDEEVVHGVPGHRRLTEGELVSLDVAAELDGYRVKASRPSHRRGASTTTSSPARPARVAPVPPDDLTRDACTRRAVAYLSLKRAIASAVTGV